jgi:glycosyltransferase involved in cell wall biosynthesis
MSSSLPPHLCDVGVLALVPERWGGAWLSRQQVLTRLAQYFHVVWVEPAYGWRRLWLHSALRTHSVNHDDIATPGFAIYRPEIWLPSLGWPRSFARFTAQQRLERACRILLKRGCRKIILYIWRPQYGKALDLIGHDLSCYHIVDEYTFSKIEKPIEERERRLLSRVDQVFIHSPALWEKKGGLNPHSLFVPNGVDYLAYATLVAEPEDLKPIPHPRIGYVGRVKQQLDLDLLITLAQWHPEWSFVLIGPQESLGQATSLIETLSQMPNVYFLGHKQVTVLPAYTQHLDVCLLCYKVNDYTKFIFPLKLHEYLASGNPIVGSPIRSLQNFTHVITLAHTAPEWSRAISASLAFPARSPEQIQARRDVAREYDWNRLVRLIARTLCGRLGPEHLERFERLPLEN